VHVKKKDIIVESLFESSQVAAFYLSFVTYNLINNIPLDKLSITMLCGTRNFKELVLVLNQFLYQ
jgi:hypothetical protein